MKIFIISMFLIVGSICFILGLSTGLKDQERVPKYTARIIHGRGKICYESEMKVDSFRLLTPWNAIVYVGEDSLKVNADWIEFHNQ